MTGHRSIWHGSCFYNSENAMPNAVSLLPSPDLPIRYASDLDGVPDAAEISFGDFLEKVEENMTFSDFIDVINPLQHIPIFSTIYRLITGDEISLGARLAGGALYGGALGVAAASLIAAFEEVTGETIEQQVAGLFDDTPGTVAETAAETAAPATLLANADKPAQIAADPARSSTAQQGAATAVEGIDDADPEIDQNISASSTTSELNNPEFFARPVSAIMAAAGRTTESVAEARQPAVPDGPRDNPKASVISTTHDVNKNQADERMRIAKSIADAQRAQAGMLLASLGSYRGMEALNGAAKDDRDDIDNTRESKDPFLAHPYALPQGASSAMMVKAMEKALNRYHQTRQQGYSGMTSAAPLGIPLAVR